MIGKVEHVDDLTIRPTTVADAPLLRELYGDMTEHDLRLRFFTWVTPDDEWYESWASIGERGGFGVIALRGEPDGTVTPVGEAGYSMRDDGDAELGIAVALGSRGGLGHRLLDELIRHAGACGIANIQADVLSDNRAMRGLLRRRGTVALEHDVGATRTSFATDGGVSTWPPDDERPRVLVEVAGGRWSGESDAAAAGLAVAVCSGPDRRAGGCPQLDGGGCPLVDGADAIVVLLDQDNPDATRLIDAHRLAAPTTHIFVESDPSVVDIAAALDDDRQDR
jgi:RimJ/RimL family protein N-acetyltransferase